MRQNKKTATKKKYPQRAGDVLVNQRMLYLVRDDLRSHIGKEGEKTAGGFVRMNALMESRLAEMGARMDARFAESDARFARIEDRLSRLEANMHEIKATIQGWESKFHQMMLLMEEQNNKNNIVLDGLSNLFHRQERVERKVDRFEEILLKLCEK